MTFKDSVKDAWREGVSKSASTDASDLVAEANANDWRYLVLKFEGKTFGHQAPGDPNLINGITSLGWRLITATDQGLYFERGS